MAFFFQVKTDPNQAIKQACVLKYVCMYTLFTVGQKLSSIYISNT